MKLRAVLIAAALLATSNVALAQKTEDVTETIGLFKGIPQVAPFFEKSYGYAVWPRIGRGGLGIGGARGKGQVLSGRQDDRHRHPHGHHVRRSSRRSSIPAGHLLREQGRLRQVHERQIRVRRFGIGRRRHGERDKRRPARRARRHPPAPATRTRAQPPGT
jgi:hypothetical protein